MEIQTGRETFYGKIQKLEGKKNHEVAEGLNEQIISETNG